MTHKISVILACCLAASGCALNFLTKTDLKPPLIHKSQLTRPDWLPLKNHFTIRELNNKIYLAQTRNEQRSFNLAINQIHQAAKNHLSLYLTSSPAHQKSKSPAKRYVSKNLKLQRFYYESFGNVFSNKDRVYDISVLWYLPLKEFTKRSKTRN